MKKKLKCVFASGCVLHFRSLPLTLARRPQLFETAVKRRLWMFTYVLRRMALAHFSLRTVYTWFLSVCSPTVLRSANANKRASLGPLGE